jgi:hypothetical protein
MTYFKNSVFKGTQETRYIQVGEVYSPANFGVAFDNCTFQLEGLKEGLLPVVVFNKDLDTLLETTEGLADLVFCDPPLEVGVEDLTNDENGSSYELDDAIPDSLRVKIGPNLDKAALVFGSFGTIDDTNLKKFRALSVRLM